jgi:hypothetical protein
MTFLCQNLPELSDFELSASISDSAMSSQSAGLLESVFRGKQHALLKHRLKKMIVVRLFLGQPARRDGQ